LIDCDQTAVCMFQLGSNQPVLNHLRIYLHKLLALRHHNKKHSHKNRTFEIIISTSVSDKILATQNVQSCIVLAGAWKRVLAWSSNTNSGCSVRATERQVVFEWAEKRRRAAHFNLWGDASVHGITCTCER